MGASDVTEDKPAQDPIDGAIEATEPDTEHTHFVNDLRWPDGTTAHVRVPIDFDSDKFETVIGALMQLRVASEQRKAALAGPAILIPTGPKLVGLDGKPIS